MVKRQHLGIKDAAKSVKSIPLGHAATARKEGKPPIFVQQKMENGALYNILPSTTLILVMLASNVIGYILSLHLIMLRYLPSW
jgi:hypothetical protein